MDDVMRPLNYNIAQETRAKANGKGTDGSIDAEEEIFRSKYRPLKYVVDKVHLDFVLEPAKTIITTDMYIGLNSLWEESINQQNENVLVLDGQETDVSLWSIAMDGKELERGIHYELNTGKLILRDPKGGSVLRTVVTIPESNTILEGLFKTDGLYCTQCEADGFRRITYFPDRPDNICLFEKVRIEACTKEYPVLLSNGIPIEKGTLDEGRRHFIVFSDVFPKPCYLFALVAGDLEYIEDFYITRPSKNKVALRIYSKAQYIDKLHHAMTSLKKAMKWDEDNFGLEYDSELYNIVAVDDFNAGAMENKSLNIFNASNILADAKNATDSDFQRVENIIAHEYFHNWTGNRVTCRDWFQLTLKEGLTVYRDQRFSGDMNSTAVKRIDTVRFLRENQFKEDTGPMSHPIRPESYKSMDNFYTSTVYEKGAEVIRMYETLLSLEGFRKGMDLYFQRHDGQAVACEEFLLAMQDANHVDLRQFLRWYSTPGTPTVSYSYRCDQSSRTLSLTLRQRSKSKQPLHIPVAVGLLDRNTGKEVLSTRVLELKEMVQVFTFPGVEGDPVPSLLRNFSAPVRLVALESLGSEESDFAFLAMHDTDDFNRWEAGQKLYLSLILKMMNGDEDREISHLANEFFERVLSKPADSIDCGLQAYALEIPIEEVIADAIEIVDFVKIHTARTLVQQLFARKHRCNLMKKYSELTKKMQTHSKEEFLVDAVSIGQRRLRNVIFQYLCVIKNTDDELKAVATLASGHMHAASGMSDRYNALLVLSSLDGSASAAREEALRKFYAEAEGYNLVVDKWFTAQALADLPDVLSRVKKLMDHNDFSFHRPNRCKALINSFTMNYKAFHDISGSGYQFVGNAIARLDRINPNASSGIASRRFIQWKRYDSVRGSLLKAELIQLKNLQPKISVDLDEIVSRALK